MHHYNKLLILYVTLAISSQIEHVVSGFFLENDCKYLNILCERKMSQVVTKSLLADVQCVGSKYPSCPQIDPSAIKSLKTFNEFICAQPREACKNITSTLNCHLIDQQSCRMREDRRESYDYHDAFEIGTDYRELNCRIEESKNEYITRICVKKDGMKVPQEPKAFVKWYLEEANMHKVLGIIEFCDNLYPIMSSCSLRLKYTMAFCGLRDEYTDAFLTYRLKRAGYSDIPKAVADYCKEDKEVREKLGDLDENGDYEFAKALEHFWRRYNLCLLKDPSTIDLELSKAFCYSPIQEEGCFDQEWHLPTERAKLIEWMCRENFSLTDSAKGDFFTVEDECFEEKFDGCQSLATVRQVLCLPVKNVSRTVSLREMINIFTSKHEYNSEKENFECLLAVDEKVTTDCYNQVADGEQIGDRLNTAICNSNQHLYQLNITGCLLSHKFNPEYISSCRNFGESDYSERSFESFENCTIPLCGKEEVEKCSLKYLKRPLWTSRDEFQNSSSVNKAKWTVFEICLNILRRSKKLDEKYDKCLRILRIKDEFEETRRFSCDNNNERERSVRSFLHAFNCKVKFGTFNRTGECSKAFDHFKSINDTSKFSEWLCKGKDKNVDEFVHLHECSGKWPRDELDEPTICPEIPDSINDRTSCNA